MLLLKGFEKLHSAWPPELFSVQYAICYLVLSLQQNNNAPLLQRSSSLIQLTSQNSSPNQQRTPQVIGVMQSQNNSIGNRGPRPLEQVTCYKVRLKVVYGQRRSAGNPDFCPPNAEFWGWNNDRRCHHFLPCFLLPAARCQGLAELGKLVILGVGFYDVKSHPQMRVIA